MGLLLQGRRRSASLLGHASLLVRCGSYARPHSSELRFKRRLAGSDHQRGRYRVGVLDPMLLGVVQNDPQRECADVLVVDGVPGRAGVAITGHGTAVSASV